MINFEKAITPRLKYLSIAWFIISAIISLEMKVMTYYKPEFGYSDLTILMYFIVQFFAGIILILLIIIPFFDRINKLKSKFARLFFLIIHGLIFGLFYTVLFSLIFELYNENTISEKYIDRLTNMLISDFHNSVRTFLIFISILIAYDYFKKNTESIILKKNVENEIGKIKLESLRAQLQPHFLFNALNNVVALIDENKTKAQTLIIDLSDLLRYTINLKPQKMVPIEEEIQLIKKYISIEKSKYEDQLNIVWMVEKNLKGTMVPPLIVQPLIENAIKHGFVDNIQVLKIEISIKPNFIRVRNNGSAIAHNYKGGQGLGIVQKRLDIHYKNKHEYKFFMEKEWVVNEIVIYENV